MKRTTQEAGAITLELGAVKQMEKAKEGIPDQRNWTACLENAEDLAKPELSSQAGNTNQGATS